MPNEEDLTLYEAAALVTARRLELVDSLKVTQDAQRALAEALYILDKVREREAKEDGTV